MKLLSLSVLQALVPQVLRAKEAAELASRAKSEFLATISHEIRTPMNAVIGLTYLCLQTGMSAQQSDYLEKVLESAKALLLLLNDILDSAKIEAGKFELETIPFSIDAILERVATVVSVKAHQKSLDFTIDTALDVPANLLGDPLRLEQILVNLASNAVKFTHSGEVGIAIRIGERTERTVWLMFTVFDSGIGMDPAQVSRLLLPFEQADSSTTRRYGGTGLGLAISRRLVELMGGSLKVESRSGEGTRFLIGLPFGLPQDGEAVRPEMPDLRGLRVLILDANAGSRKVLHAHLEAFHFRVADCACLDEAYAVIGRGAAKGCPVDLLFVDPRTAGSELVNLESGLAEACAGSRQPRLILLAPIAEANSFRRFFGVDAILQKPFTHSRLFNTVALALGDAERVLVCGKGQRDGEGWSQALRGKRVLLVEDDELNLQVAHQLLVNLGMRVDSARDGAEALERLVGERFDVVLMDIHMPVMDGYMATRAIRETHAMDDLPVIAMTANVMLHERERCLLAGMNDHIPKPIDPERLASTLVQWVSPALVGQLHPAEPMPAGPFLPALRGVNVPVGLWRTGGELKHYLGLLERFHRNYSGWMARVAQDLAGGAIEEAVRKVHSLKGLAGSLGAEELQARAGELEALLDAGPGEPALCSRAMDSVAALLADFCLQIETLAGQVDDGVLPAVSGLPALQGEDAREKLLSLLAAAVGHLEEYDARIDDLVDEVAQIASCHPDWMVRWKEVDHLVRSYDYEQALERVLDWIEAERRRSG